MSGRCDNDHADTDPALRQQAYHAISDALAGHFPIDAAIAALADHMAQVVAFAVDDFEQADRFVDDLCGDLKRAIRLNWEDVKKIARADMAHRPAEGTA